MFAATKCLPEPGRDLRKVHRRHNTMRFCANIDGNASFQPPANPFSCTPFASMAAEEQRMEKAMDLFFFFFFFFSAFQRRGFSLWGLSGVRSGGALVMGFICTIIMIVFSRNKFSFTRRLKSLFLFCVSIFDR